MANKHMKRCSTLYIIKEMQIKTRYHYTPIKMAKICIWNTDNIKCWQRCEATGILIHFWQACKIIQPLWKIVWPFLTKLHILVPCNPAILLLDIYSKSWKFMFSQEPATLFTTSKTWKQSKCSLGGKWINYVISRQWNAIWHKKKWAIEPQKDILNAYY